MGKAKSYAEGLFDFPAIGALPRDAADQAIAKPANDQGVQVSPEALDLIYSKTQGYAYFLQEWGKPRLDRSETN